MALPKVDTEELAQVLGVDDRTIRRLQKKNVLERGEKGFDLADAVQRYVTYREAFAAEQSGSKEYSRARTALVREQVKKAERERLVSEGAYIATNEVHDSWAKVIVLIRTNFMALPVRAAAHLVALKTPMEAQAVLDPMVREILTELQQTEITVQQPDSKESAA